MNTKTLLTLTLLLISTLTLTACNPLKGYGQEAGANGKSKRFKNARGGNVWGCDNEPMKANEGNSYLKNHGLPLEIGGNFICENGKPALPKDCQGREIRSEAELRVFWEKHQLPVGYVWWECHNGIPKVAPSSIKGWHDMEVANPTCKDARGRKRPCV